MTRLAASDACSPIPPKYRNICQGALRAEPLVEKFREYKARPTDIARAEELAQRRCRRCASWRRRSSRRSSAKRDALVAGAEGAAGPEGSERREERHPRNSRRHRRRRSGAVRGAISSGCTRATPSGTAGSSRSCRSSDSGVGGLKEVIASIEGKRRLQPPEVRERRPPRAARAGDRGQRPHPHVHRHGGRSARSRGSRHPDRREGPAGRHLLLERPRRPERQHHLLRGPHHPHPDRRSSCRSRTRSPRSRIGRRR